jgi:hypothetical protein
VSDDHRFPVQATDDRLFIVGDLADPLAREQLGVLSRLGDGVGIVRPPGVDKRNREPEVFRSRLRPGNRVGCAGEMS